jgi:hypothetical protein
MKFISPNPVFKSHISRHTLHQHCYTCPISLPVRRNPQHRSILTCLSHFRTWSGISCNFLTTQLWTALRDDTSHRKQETFLCEYPLHWVLLPRKTHIRTLLLGSIVLEHGLHFDYWNQPLNMRMRVCYLDCHVAGLCCYLVVHIENLLRPLQLFYFHLWPIYWLSLVYCFVVF